MNNSLPGGLPLIFRFSRLNRLTLSRDKEPSSSSPDPFLTRPCALFPIPLDFLPPDWFLSIIPTFQYFGSLIKMRCPDGRSE